MCLIKEFNETVSGVSGTVKKMENADIMYVNHIFST